jgi:hypothetical protein
VVRGPAVDRGHRRGREWDDQRDLILPDVTLLLRVMLRLGVSVVSDAERYPGGNGITSGSISDYIISVTIEARKPPQ